MLDSLSGAGVAQVHRKTAMVRAAVLNPVRSISGVVVALLSFVAGICCLVYFLSGGAARWVDLFSFISLCVLVGGMAGSALTLILYFRR